MKKEIIFLLTHKLNSQIKKNIWKIYREKGERDFLILSHQEIDSNKLPVDVHFFSLQELQSLNVRMLENCLIPGSAHLPVLFFFDKFPDYDHYWLIEYDVEFGGNWKRLFDTYKECDADFISCYLQRYQKKKHWPWWAIEHPEKLIPISDRIRSFNPIYRISKEALTYLKQELTGGWVGHSEVLLPTILQHNNFKLLDFAQEGEFSNPLYPGFYKKSVQFPTKDISFLNLGTMRYRPAMKKAGFRKVLYHPVKKETGLTTFEEIIFQLSLFKGKIEKHVEKISKKISVGENRPS